MKSWNKTKTWLVIFSVAIIVSGLFSGCSKKQDEVSQPSQQDIEDNQDTEAENEELKNKVEELENRLNDQEEKNQLQDCESKKKWCEDKIEELEMYTVLDLNNWSSYETTKTKEGWNKNIENFLEERVDNEDEDKKMTREAREDIEKINMKIRSQDAERTELLTGECKDYKSPCENMLDKAGACNKVFYYENQYNTRDKDGKNVSFTRGENDVRKYYEIRGWIREHYEDDDMNDVWKGGVDAVIGFIESDYRDYLSKKEICGK